MHAIVMTGQRAIVLHVKQNAWLSNLHQTFGGLYIYISVINLEDFSTWSFNYHFHLKKLSRGWHSNVCCTLLVLDRLPTKILP